MTATTRPRDFGFDDEAVMLQGAARRLFHDHLPTEALHRLVAASSEPARASACVWDAGLWARMVDLGWTAIAVPTEAGGFGMRLAAIAGLAEEVGRAAAPSPLPVTLAATYVLAACGTEAAAEALRCVAEGLAVSLALADRHGSWVAADTEVVADADDRLAGTAWFVQDARKVEAFVVAARGPAGVGLWLVEVGAVGVTITPDAIHDLTRDQARVTFDSARATCVAAPGDGARALRAAEPALLVIAAADMVGAAEWQLQTTAAYARTRVQFERPIGFFQAVKHPLVDMMLAIDAARSLVYDAACAVDYDDADAAETCARMAKAAAGDAAELCSGRSVQLHGGIGFTWECFVQIYFKRQMHGEVLYGDAAWQRARLADKLIGPIGGER